MRTFTNASAAMLATLLFASASLAGGPVGWRTDGLGKYPSAEPPTEWSAERNVVWATPGSAWNVAASQPAGSSAKRLPPTWSNGTPVLVGDKIFITAELTDLVCLSKADGKVLWSRGNAYEDYMTEQDKAQAAQDKVQADKIRKDEIAPLTKQIGELQREVGKLAPRTTQPDGTEAKAQVADFKTKIAAMNKQLAELNAKLVTVTRWEIPGTHGTNGQSSATPSCDGKLVCVSFNTGTAACYDLDGNRKWIKFLEKPAPGGYGVCASPVLCGDRVLIAVKALYALDAQTGKELWKNDQVEQRFGTPMVTKVGQLDVAITASGDVVRMSDGKLLAKKLCVLAHCAPIVHDGVAYFIQNGSKAVKLSPKGEDDIEAKEVWSVRYKKEDKNHYASPIFHEGADLHDQRGWPVQRPGRRRRQDGLREEPGPGQGHRLPEHHAGGQVPVRQQRQRHDGDPLAGP